MTQQTRSYFDPIVALYGVSTIVCATVLVIVGLITGKITEAGTAAGVLGALGTGLISSRYARLTPAPLRPGEARVTSEISGSIPRDKVLELMDQRKPDHRPRILIIEDDRDCRDTLGQVLRGHGFQVMEAEDGAAALHTLQGPGELPDLILLDLFMPRLNGWEFRGLQLEDPRLKDIPVIVLSGRDPEGLNLTGVRYFSKPVNLDGLELAILDALPGPR